MRKVNFLLAGVIFVLMAACASYIDEEVVGEEAQLRSVGISIAGPSVIFPGGTATFTVSNLPANAVVVWPDPSSNLRRISPNAPPIGNTATFEVIDHNVSVGWIEAANLPGGVTLRHYVQIGSPFSVRYDNISIWSPNSAFVGVAQPIQNWQFFNVGAAPNASLQGLGGRRFGGHTNIELVAEITNDCDRIRTFRPGWLQFYGGITVASGARCSRINHQNYIRIAPGATVQVRFECQFYYMQNYEFARIPFPSYGTMRVSLTARENGGPFLPGLETPPYLVLRQNVQRHLAWR